MFHLSIVMICKRLCLHRLPEVLMMDLCAIPYQLKLSSFPWELGVQLSVRSPVLSAIAGLPVSHLWWQRWKLRSAPCPLLPHGLQTLGSVCFACCAEWKLLPPSGRWCSACSSPVGAQDRGLPSKAGDLLQTAPHGGAAVQTQCLWQHRDLVAGTFKCFVKQM